MNMYVLVLDFDGVITDLNIDWSAVRSEVSSAIGFKVESMLAFWENYFGAKLFNIANDITEKYEQKAALDAKPFDDVKPALEDFEGIVYLASMQSEKITASFLERYDLKKYFKEILGRERFASKEVQLQYIHAKERDTGKTLLVDDSRRNVENCSKLGVKCILLNRKSGDNLLGILRNELRG